MRPASSAGRSGPARALDSHALRTVLLAGLALAGALLWAGANSGSMIVHPETMDCADCHLAGRNVSADDAHILTRSQEALCGGCHQGALEVSHPTGVRPARVLPAAYPLDWKSEMTCSTCHDVHSDAPGRIRGEAQGRDLCLQCHEANFFDQMRDGGSSIVVSGHVNAQPDRDPLDLDPYSAQCLACHEDQGEVRGVRVGGRSIVRHAGSAVNHPIGMRYANYLSYGGFRQPGRVPEGILMPDGKIACVSCHEGYVQEHGTLVMSNRGSALCFGCHDL